MPIYEYKGLTKTGKEVKNTLTAESIIQAKHRAKSEGIMLLEIKEKKSKGQNSGSSFKIGKKINVEDLALMTRQLATLVRAKIQIVEALAALQDQVENEHLKVILSELKQDVNEGASLAKALGKHPKTFNNVYVNMVEAGEESGTLEVVLLRLADFTEAQMKLINKIKGAMMYPIIMMLVGTALISGIFIFVIPKLAKIFVSMKMELPVPTKICIAVSNYMQAYWWSIPLILFSSFWLFNKWKESPKGKLKWHSFTLKAPVFGTIVKMINVSRFCSTLATLLSSGVPILVSLKIVKNLIANVHMQEAVENAKEAVQEGASMATPLSESGHFPSMVTHMITLGERSGELEEMLAIVSENYEEQVDSKINGLTTTLEPIMIIGMGITVLFIVLSVIMPMMQLNQAR
ncbi:MAG: type II secretion system inner membrane protein GspF [Bacteriovoracaceae bacterium]|jgi:general secretion pathway protein F|nr:type II secretion system protein GspF [Halobacteriovoraceae bacterium]MDP7320463.1 type II secretion system inner membrane protein GspF [Bacteriovoracaceae bacterium]